MPGIMDEGRTGMGVVGIGIVGATCRSGNYQKTIDGRSVSAGISQRECQSFYIYMYVPVPAVYLRRRHVVGVGDRPIVKIVVPQCATAIAIPV